MVTTKSGDAALSLEAVTSYLSLYLELDTFYRNARWARPLLPPLLPHSSLYGVQELLLSVIIACVCGEIPQS